HTSSTVHVCPPHPLLLRAFGLDRTAAPDPGPAGEVPPGPAGRGDPEALRAYYAPDLSHRAGSVPHVHGGDGAAVPQPAEVPAGVRRFQPPVGAGATLPGGFLSRARAGGQRA